MVFKIRGEWIHGGGCVEEWKGGDLVRTPLCPGEEGNYALGDKGEESHWSHPEPQGPGANRT